MPATGQTTSIDRSTVLRRIFFVFWVFALLLGGIQAWTSRFDMAWDGVQYLDNADAYLRGDWRNAANTQWSPMYPWLLGAALHLLKPSSYWEFPVLHLVNFIVFLAVLVSFQYFLSTLLTRLRLESMSAQTIAAVACGAFLYATLDLTSVTNPTPDLTMSVFVFLTAAFLVRIMTGERGFGIFSAMGITLGLGYIAKAPFFVYSFVCFAILLALVFRDRGGVARLAAVSAAFLITAGPYIAFLSVSKGRLTYGDSGRYNVVWMVNGVPYYHWQGEPAGSGTPLHPSRKLSSDPPVYEFATPIGGTYPPWYDPVYWNEGAKVRYRAADFLHALIRNTRHYFYMFHHRQTPLICGFLILFLLVPRKLMFARELRKLWPILVFAVFPFAMYAMIHVDPRFFGAFFVLLWTVLFAAAILALGELPQRVIYVVAFTAAGLMTVEAALVAGPTQPLTGVQIAAMAAPSPTEHWEIAQALNARGVHEGDQAAIIGNQFPYYWARLARVRIVAEVLPRDFSNQQHAHDETKAEWDRAKTLLAETPAKFVVSPTIPGIVDQPGWERLGSTEAFYYRLAP